MKPLALSLLLGFAVVAQTSLKFETVSITRGRPDQGVKGGCHGTDSVFTPHQMESAPPLGQCVITNARLSRIVAALLGGRGFIELKRAVTTESGQRRGFHQDALNRALYRAEHHHRHPSQPRAQQPSGDYVA
jgi:hypothetical protein